MQFTEVPISAIDAQARAAGRLLWEFQSSPFLLSVLHALVSEIQTFIDACVQVQQLRMPADATGVNLDAIGRIVGQDRVLIDYSEINWFEADTINCGVDQSPVWCNGAPLYNLGSANDTLYRILIQAKVYRNFIQYGSIPEIQEAVSEAFGVPVSFQQYAGGPMDLVLIVPDTIPLYVLGFLTRQLDTIRADAEYMPPYPATARVCGVMFLLDSTVQPPVMFGNDAVLLDDNQVVFNSSTTFKTDTINAGADFGKVSVSFTFN